MSLTVFKHTYNGNAIYGLQFKLGYLDKSHIHVYSGDDSTYTEQLNYSWVDDNTIQLEETLPDLGSEFSIRRVVPRDDLLAYFEGARLKDYAIDNLHKQLLMVSQEISDGFTGDSANGGISIRGVLDMNDYRIINLGAPTEDTDAIRLIDITGGVTEPRGVVMENDDTFMQIETQLPVPTVDQEVFSLEMDVKLHETAYSKTLCVGTDYAYIGLNADNTKLIGRNSQAVDVEVDITSFGLPYDEVTLGFEVRLNVSVLELRMKYDVQQTAWLVWDMGMDWQRFFGGSGMETGVGYTIYEMRYIYSGLQNIWKFNNVQSRTILSTLATYIGTLYGDHYSTIDDTIVTIPINVAAEEVTFEPYGTGFDETATDVDKVLREVDTAFLRRQEVDQNPDAPDGTPLTAYYTWLVDTTVGPRTRPLPAAPKDGDIITVRDDKGGIVIDDVPTNIITIQGNGKTIMGLNEDMTVNTNWSWFELRYVEVLDDWRVVGGGVGGQVLFIPETVVTRVYPVGHILLSMNPQNPAVYLQFGVWARVGVGRVLMGEGTSVDDNGVERTFATGNSGGEWSHTITKEELPSDAEVTIPTRKDNGNNSGGEYYASDEGDDGDNMQGYLNGGDESFDTANPGFACYIWHRTS